MPAPAAAIVNGRPMCCGHVIVARIPECYCMVCYSIFDYQQLRDAIAGSRLGTTPALPQKAAPDRSHL